MSFLQFTFRPTLIPAYAQAEFISRFAQLVLDYETLIEPTPPSPPADSLPPPTSFVPVEGDEPPSAPKRESAWSKMTPEQREERLAKLKAGREAKRAARKMSDDSLTESAPAPAPAPVPAPVAEAEVVVVETGSVAPSETSSAKQRKNGWADLTPEQKADRLARAAATRQARRATKMASASSDGESA
jgi:predicted Fe-S protein YdhL (DUF1289 family)